MLHFSLFILAPLLGFLITCILFLRLHTLRSFFVVTVLSFILFQFLTEPAVFHWTFAALPMSVNYVLHVVIYASMISPLVFLPLLGYRYLTNNLHRG